MALRASSDPFPPDPITVCEAAGLVRVSRKTISRRMARGQLRVWRDRGGRSLRLSRADVLELWQARAPGGPRPRKPPRDRQAEIDEADRRARERLGLPVE